MSNITNLHNELANTSEIDVEAGAWIIKLDGETELSREERQAFKEWMGRSPAHREAVKSLAQFWGKMNVLTELAIPRQLASEQADREQGRHRGRQLRFSIITAPLATAFSLFLLVGILWLQLSDQNQSSNGLYATAVGQQRIVELGDGSTLQLNTNSQIQVAYSENYRDIHLLQGEAHFTVTKNQQKPFRVSAGNGLVQAIGTAFSVHLNHGDIEVVITEGRVGLQSRTSADMPITIAQADHDLGQLTAGQSAVIKDVVNDQGEVQSVHATIAEVSPQELERRLSWRKGYITFKGASLAQVVDEVGRYSQMSIELTDPAMAAIKIGGQFRVGEVDAMLESLEKNFGLKVKRISYNHVQISYISNE